MGFNSAFKGLMVKTSVERFDVLLTVHLSVILAINPYPANVENRVSS